MLTMLDAMVGAPLKTVVYMSITISVSTDYHVCMYVSCLGAVDGGDVGGEVREDLGRRDGFAVGLLEGDMLAGFGEGDLVGGPRSVDHNIRKD